MKVIKKSELKKMNDISVINMTSSGGNHVPNQFIITLPDMEIFQSYQTTIAVKIYDKFSYKIVLDENNWNCSATTNNYLNKFLGCNKKECQKLIDSGEYQLTNLN